MTKEGFKVITHMVSSLDGFIAKKDNSVYWFETTSNYEKGVDAENPEEFLKSVGCYVMGSKTYELAVELSKKYGWVYGDKLTIVLTKRNLQSDRPNVEFFSGDLGKLMEEKLKPKYDNAWVVGGAGLTKSIIRQGLADEIRVYILPIILGDGLPYFDQIGEEYPLHLLDTKAFKNGMVELCYGVRK